MIITVQARNTITIPRELRQALALKPGSPMQARVGQGKLILTPLAAEPRALHLTASGEAKEAEAEDDIHQGRISKFDSAERARRLTAPTRSLVSSTSWRPAPTASAVATEVAIVKDFALAHACRKDTESSWLSPWAYSP